MVWTRKKDKSWWKFSELWRLFWQSWWYLGLRIDVKIHQQKYYLTRHGERVEEPIWIFLVQIGSVKHITEKCKSHHKNIQNANKEGLFKIFLECRPEVVEHELRAFEVNIPHKRGHCRSRGTECNYRDIIKNSVILTFVNIKGNLITLAFFLLYGYLIAFSGIGIYLVMLSPGKSLKHLAFFIIGFQLYRSFASAFVLKLLRRYDNVRNCCFRPPPDKAQNHASARLLDGNKGFQDTHWGNRNAYGLWGAAWPSSKTTIPDIIVSP